MANPIQKRLLIHTVTHHAYIADDFLGERWEDGVILQHVRVEPKTALVRTGTGDMVESSTIMFVDAVNSDQPVSGDFSEKEKIVFLGKEMQIVAVNHHYDAERFHHWELMLK